MRFLKEYQLLSAGKGDEVGLINHLKSGQLVSEYRKIGTERAQLAYKQTIKQKCARLNFEQFLYAMKILSIEVYPPAHNIS